MQCFRFRAVKQDSKIQRAQSMSKAQRRPSHVRATDLVNKQILATGIGSDETEAFCGVKPCIKEDTSECQRSVALDGRRR